MALQKQPVNINFAQGIDTKSDPWQIPIGKFSNLINSVFTKAGRLTKRNGFAPLSSTNLQFDPTFVTTWNGSLIAMANKLQAYAPDIERWNFPLFRPNVQLSTSQLFGGVDNLQFCDSATSDTGLTCIGVNTTRQDNSGITTSNLFLVQVIDSVSGQQLTDTFALNTVPIDRTGSIRTYPRVFSLGNYFVICYTKAGGGEIDFVTFNKTTLAFSSPVTLTTSGTSSFNSLLDGIVYNNVLYLGYQATSSDISIITLDSNLVIGTPVVVDSANGMKALSLTVDSTDNTLWISYVDVSTGKVWSAALTTPGLASILPSTQVFTSTVSFYATTMTSLATAGTNTIYVTFPEQYTVSGSNYANIKSNTITEGGSTGGSDLTYQQELSLASKAFFIGNDRYMLAQYLSPVQSTYFLLKTNPDSNTALVASRLAYIKAYSELFLIGLPLTTVIGTDAYISYLSIDAEQPVGATPGTPRYNYGARQVKFSFSNLIDTSVELSGSLAFSGGFLWDFNGGGPTENNFFLFPEYIAASASSGSLTPQAYTYYVLYTSISATGTKTMSAPSPPLIWTVSPSTAGVLLEIPTARVSQRVGINIEIYRSSTAQPIPYRINPGGLANDPTISSITYHDTFSDAQILGNEVLYTNDGTNQDTGAPSTSILTIWDRRLWMVNAEDPQELWYSKVSIADTPIEMSNLQTYFISEDLGSQGPTGGVTALAAMDDKLIVFTGSSIRYINGSGPDATGANDNYSQPIHITSTTGCIGQSSIALIPTGLIFQSDKGIWLLGRDLSTRYIGAPVENYTQFNTNTQLQPKVVSTVVIPDSTQVRLVLDSGLILMYDYFYDQWGSFTGIAAASSTLYQGLHTFVTQSNVIVQETPGTYADSGSPVNMSFQTGWINLAGLQGYERAYYFYLLGQWLSAHMLQLQIAYDYISTPAQTSIITPIQQNIAPQVPSLDDLEQWRVFLQTQKCQAFQITLTEIDSSVGEGLTLSGINMVIGRKKGYPVRRQNLSVG